jgi:hypothetical protein
MHAPRAWWPHIVGQTAQIVGKGVQVADDSGRKIA